MNKPLKNESEGQEVALNPSDVMLSVLLDDFLGENEPPDFRTRILAKLEHVATGKELSSQSGFVEALCSCSEYDEAIQAASHERKNGYGAIIPSAPVEIAEASDGDFDRWIRRGVFLVVALAAAVLGLIFLPDRLRSRNATNSPAKIANSGIHLDNPNSVSSGPLVVEDITNKDSSFLAENLVKTPSKLKNNIEQKDALVQGSPESIAVHSVIPSKQVLPPIDTNISTTSVALKVMGNEEVVGIIDNQLSYLWNRVGLTAAPNVSTDIWLDRAAVAILGRQATTAEKESFRSSKNESRVVSYVDNLVSSNEFSRYWSIQLAEHYLGKRISTSQERTVSENAFVEWLEESLVQKLFIGDIERQMIDGQKNVLDGQNVRTDPASYWLSETMERAATNQREPVELVPSIKRRQPPEESLIGVSRQLMRLSGNPSMVCSQCHIDESSGSDLRGYISMSKTQATGGSSTFWSVPANLSGLTILNQTAGRSLRSEPRSDYFYEDGEGRMKLATAAPPSLRKGKVSMTLGEWFGSSNEPRRAIVEMVWGQVFKQPLVPVTGLSEDEGLSERVDLRELLASQMQLQNADLGTLVRWIVLSKSLRLEGPKTDAPWYLKSTESQIADSQRQLRMFAGFHTTNSFIAESGKLSPGRAVSWIDQKRSFQKADAATLAQGANNKLPGMAQKPTKLDYSEDQVRYLVSIEKPYSRLRALAERWGKSSMSWQMLIEHAYLATDARFPSQLERDEAIKLLEASGQDRARTLVMIVNARLGSW